MSLRLTALPFLLFCVCALGVQAQSSSAVKKLEGERTELQKQIKESEALLRSNKKDVKSQLNNILLLSAQIGRQQEYVAGIAYEVDSLTKRINALQRELKGLQRELDECKEKFQRSLMYMHRNRTAANKLMFIFSAENFKQAYRRIRYVEEYAKYQRAQGEILKQKAQAVKNAQAKLLAAKKEKDQLLADGKAEQEKLEGQKNQRQNMVDKLKRQQKKLQTALTQQQKKQKQLDAKIDKLIKEQIAAAERKRKEEERKRKAAEEKARKAAAKANAAKGSSKSASGKKPQGKSSSNSTASGKTATPFAEPKSVDKQLSSDFASNKGKLPMPITGGYAITGRFGNNNVEGLRGVRLDNKGINITGRKGAQARCIFDGEVTSVFSFGGYVNVIVRHGSYISVYCNLSKANVRLGQKVKTKQIIGTVATDESGNATLHFQLRKETTKLNPQLWLGR